MLIVAFLIVAAAPSAEPQTPAPDGFAATREIKRSLTPGFTTRIRYPATLACPGSIAMLMPEPATRVGGQGVAHPECKVDARGKISQCSKLEEAGASDLYWPTAAAAMAQVCKVAAPTGDTASTRFTFEFETR